MNGGRGVGWGLMKGEGVLLGRRHPCARSSSGEGGGMGNDGGGGCWAVVVCGHSSSVGGGSLLAVCASSLYMGGAPLSGGILVVRGWGFFCPWALLVVGVVVRGWGLFSVAGRCRLWALAGRFDRGRRSSFVGVGCRSWGWLVVLGGWVIDCGGWGSFA